MSVSTNSLESLCELIVDCPHSTPTWTDEGIVVLRNQNIKSGVLDLSSPSFTNEEDYQKRIKRADPQAGDIVFTREAPMGEVCMIPEGLKCCLGQRQVLLRPKKSINGKYLFWALQSPFVQHQISWNEGTGSTVSNVRIPVLKALNIPRHPRQEDQIAEVLSNVADKIQLNRQTNQTLEQIAQAIFKSWFVDFEPVKAKAIVKQKGGNELAQSLAAQACICGAISLEQLQDLENDFLGLEEQLHPLITERFPDEFGLDYWSPETLHAIADLFPNTLVESELGEVPEGWVHGTLSDIACYSSDRIDVAELTHQNYVSTENMLESKNGITDATALPNVKTVPSYQKGQVLVSNIRPYFKKIWFARRDGGRSADVLGFDSLEEGCEEFLYNVLYQDRFFDYMMQGSKGAKMPRGDKVAIMNYVVPLSPVQVRVAFSRLVAQFYEHIESQLSQNLTLCQLRDTLLPKLLSGELSLDQARAKKEAVA